MRAGAGARPLAPTGRALGLTPPHTPPSTPTAPAGLSRNTRGERAPPPARWRAAEGLPRAVGQAEALRGAGTAGGHGQGPPPRPLSRHSTYGGDGTVLFISLLYRTWFLWGPGGHTDTACADRDPAGAGGGGELNPRPANPSGHVTADGSPLPRAAGRNPRVCVEEQVACSVSSTPKATPDAIGGLKIGNIYLQDVLQIYSSKTSTNTTCTEQRQEGESPILLKHTYLTLVQLCPLHGLLAVVSA